MSTSVYSTSQDNIVQNGPGRPQGDHKVTIGHLRLNRRYEANSAPVMLSPGQPAGPVWSWIVSSARLRTPRG